MDPLSVGASVLAVVGATGKVIKGIRRLKAIQDAPRELEDLLAEISQFELVLQSIQNSHESPGSELGRILETAQRILVDFESLVEYELTEAGTSDRVDRWQWTSKSKDVQRLREKLRDVMMNILAVVGVNTSKSILHVSQVTNQVLSEQRRFSDEILPAVALLRQFLVESPSAADVAMNGSLENVRQVVLESALRDNCSGSRITRGRNRQADQKLSHAYFQSVVPFSKFQRFSICDRYCDCKCHNWKRLGASGILSKIFGRGYIRTAGSIICGTQCDTDMCRAHIAPCISVQYSLPPWLASRMVFIWFTSSLPCSPELLLQIPRVIGKDNRAIRAILKNDVEQLKYAIMHGDCTPHDVNENGNALFSLAIVYSRWEIMFCLLSYQGFSTSAVTLWAEEMIWRRLVLSPSNPLWLHPNGQNPTLSKVLPLVDWECRAERQAFTMLHQIVCGLSGLSLEVGLQGSTAIDDLDKNGRSALWYAVKHRRLNYVCRLLEQGANPNIGDPPIWAATAGCGDYAITKVLLDRGASLSPNLSPAGENGWLPWPNDIFGEDMLAIDELLIRHGIKLNHQARWFGIEDVTILMRLSSYPDDSSPLRMEQLIKSGVDIEITDEEGKTAIMYAISASFHQACRVLVRAGARLDLKTSTGSTILHLAITQASCNYSTPGVYKLCEVFCDTDLTKLDLDAKDEDENRAFDLLKMRNGPNWNEYHQSKGTFKRCSAHINDMTLKEELEAISALERLLHHIQEVQGVSEEDRYPPLGEYRGADPEDNVVPGAWPM